MSIMTQIRRVLPAALRANVLPEVTPVADKPDHPTTKIGDIIAMSDQDIRVEAYNLAVRRGSYGVTEDELHKLAADIAENIRHGFTKKRETFQAKPGTPDFQDAIDAIYGRTEWRREGWNDCKAVMLGALRKQLNGEQPIGKWMLSKTKNTLHDVRDFIASFDFDPSKP
jgi:hypothetical protein